MTDPRVRPLQLVDVESLRIAMVHDMEPEDDLIEELRRKNLGASRLMCS